MRNLSGVSDEYTDRFLGTTKHLEGEPPSPQRPTTTANHRLLRGLVPKAEHLTRTTLGMADDDSSSEDEDPRLGVIIAAVGGFPMNARSS